MAKDTISYEDAFGLTSTPAAPSTGSISYEEAFGLPPAPPKRRTLASIANDTVIEVANAAAGGVSAAANFVRPGNAVSGFIDKNIVEAGEASQSDATKAEKQRFRQGVANADGVMDELGAVGSYVVNNPVLAAAQAAGSFVGPGLAVKGGRTLASVAGLNAARGGLAGGAAAGAAMAGGDAAGTAYELASKAGATDEQAVAAGRGASVLPAVIGGVGGVVGAERLVAGAKGFAGNAASRALKTGAVEGAQEAIEEGVTQYEGQRAAMPFDATIDPTKGVAAAAGMGAALGGATGAGASLLTGGQAIGDVPDTAPALNQQAQAAIKPVATTAIDPNAGPLSKAASMAGDLGLTPVPAAPTAQDQRAQLDATIARLPDAEQREARLNLADLDNESLPAGVRAMRDARLQELVGGAPAAPVELIPSDMERGRVMPGFDARVDDAPPTRLSIAPEQGQQPIDGIAFDAPAMPALAVNPDEARITQLALDADLTPGEPMQLNKAHALRRAAAAEGITMSVIPHPSGRGYDVAPTARLDPAARAAMPQDEAAAQLPFDQSPSGRMVASSGGGVRAETRPEAVARGNTAAAQRQGVEAERQRRTELGLSNITPVTPVREGGSVSRPPLAFDNSPTGRMVAGADGLRAERRSEAVNRNNPPAPAPAPQTVASASGAPFASRQVAQQALQRQQLAGTHEVVPAGGDESLGFVLQEKGRNQPPALDSKAQAATESVADRAPNWRTNALQANRIARGLGIDTKGKRVAEVVAEIDTADSQRNQPPALNGQAQEAINSVADLDRANGLYPPGAATRVDEGRWQPAVKTGQGAGRSIPGAPAFPDAGSAAAWAKYEQAKERAGADVQALQQLQDSIPGSMRSEGVATTTMRPTESAPELVAASADVESAGGTSGPRQGGGLQQERPPRSGPRAKSDGNQAPALGAKAQAAIKSGVNSKAASPGAAPRSTTRIDDFGETLQGARKMLYAEAYADGMAKAKELDTRSHPLSKTWPEPDYQKLLEGGTSRAAVDFARAARDHVPTKPQAAWKTKGWAQLVEQLRGLADDAISGRIDTSAAMAATRAGDFRGQDELLQGAVALYGALGHDRSLKGLKLTRDKYSLYDGVRHDPPRVIWTVSREAKGSAFGNWPRELAKGDTREAAIAAFKKRAEELLAEERAPAKGATFEIYGKRAGGAREFFIGKKIGRNVAELKAGFADIKAARQYLADNQPELENLLDKYKAIPPVRSGTNAPRIGEDYRKGADVTPEQFQEAFGFRGVQFGNYVEGGRRQQDLNQAYDALMDLAAVLNLPPRALSLGGRLGLAFGARGTGGTDAAAAHYERGNIVINLTKREGAGSLAHEWWHGLDNYFSRERGDGGGFMTEREQGGEGVREEMRAAFREVNGAINRTRMQERSRKLDDRRTKDYWTTKPEMSARAFESYVIAKLQDQNAGNDYLANVVGASAFALEGGYPYPTAGELPVIRGAFDGFFETVETRQGEGGETVLFSRDGAGQTPDMASVDSVRAAVRELVNGIGTLPNQLGRVVVATSQEIQRDWQPLIGPVSMESADTGRAEGFYDPKTKTVFLIADNIRKGDEMAVAAHELMHKHGQAVLGEQGWNQLHDVIGTWAKATPGSTERAVYDEAARRVRATGQELANQEMFPYAVQVALEMGVRPNAMKPQGSVARWLAQVRSALRTVWNKIAGQKGDFNSLDLVNLAFGIAQRENPAHTVELDAAMAESATRAQDALKEISDAEDLFALPKSDKDTVTGIAAEHDPEIKVRTTELGGETMYTLALPDGTRATITSREPTRDEVFGMDQATGRWISARPGENAPPVGSRSDVWVDVSALKPGQNGARVYNIAATFAKNTGRIFIGDPSGLSDAALRRRAEQMLSSALKFGTTDHLAPHPRQVAGDAALGVPPLRWVYGDHAGNIERLVDVNQQALENAYPDAKNLSYDLDTGNFINARTGEVVSRAELAELAGRSTPRASGSMERAAEAGWRTVARGAVFRALLREGSPSGEGRGQGGRLLDGLVRQRAQLESASERSGDRIFYSRRGVTPGEPDAPALAQRIGAAIQGATVTNLKQQAGFKATDYRGLGLQVLGRRQLVDVYGDMLPEMRRYSDLIARMDADKNEAGSGADQLAQDWAKLPDERVLAELMHDSTLAQIDPTKDFVEGDNKTDWTKLQARYNALSPGAKDVYTRARDTYRQHMRDVRSAIKERIERTEMSSERRAALIKRMDDEFFGHIKGVYFPLARFGQYLVVVKDAEGKVANVSRAETMAEADTTRRQLVGAFPAGKGYTVGKVLKAKDFVAERDSVGRGFMEQLYGVLDKQGMDTKQRAELEDALGQLYLSSLPDLSWAKHGIHRKGTAGFSQDARRAFAQNVFHGASYLAKLRYGDRLQDELGEMQRRVDAGSTDSGFDSVKAQQVVDEMVKRHDAAMNPKTNAVSTALTSLGFIFHLGLSPASAMVNLTQTALVAYPVMGAKWGFKKASTALLKASGEAARGKNDITGSLSAEEKAAFDEAVRSGVIDVTMAHDLAGIAQGEDQNVSYKLRPVMRAASWMFHHAEKFNRQVTFVAAYRLAREAGANDKVAYEQAVQATYDGHFDYSSNNRPRAMQGNVARVVLLFKQYGQNMVYTLMRNAHQSLKGASPAERAQARKALGGLLTMHGLAAGALGLPMVTTLLSAASMLGGDDDEPWDAQVALQNMLADTFGQKPAEVMAHGLSRLTPWDISGRVGLDKLIFPDVQEGLEGQRLGESAMTAALGPVAGIGINVLKGLQDMGDGRYLRGLEAMAPSVLRGPLKSFRYGTEGVRDKSGIVVQDEVGAAELLGQASGFSPSSVRNSFEGKSAVMQHDRALQARRSALVEQFAMAAMAGDDEGKASAREDIAAFNEKNPNRRILPMQLAQSVNMRQKRIREAQEGVYLPSKRRDALEAGRFAVPN
ncbi:MAG: PLxRFG domain-containing protein [Acidovorax sp.]|nr:PLxRFG domain-containing protein [Acidovorax sp.]